MEIPSKKLRFFQKKSPAFKDSQSFIITFLGINKAAKVITKVQISSGIVFEDQGGFEKILAENCMKNLEKISPHGFSPRQH